MTAAILFQESVNTPCFVILSESIEESLLSIDRFELQVSDELILMRDKRIFEEGGYGTFEQYCEAKLSRWGGYRRVNQLIGAKQVIDSLKGTEFDGVIKRESHARPLLRLIKKPEKLVEAVAIAFQNNAEPIAANFKEAVAFVDPSKRTKSKSSPEVATTGETPARHFSQEQLFLKGAKVRVSSPNNPRYGQECAIVADAPNRWQQIVEFEDGERVTIHNKELDSPCCPYTPVHRTPTPRTYTEDELQQLINKAIQEAKIGELSSLREQAEKESQEQLNAARAIASQRGVEVAKLRQQLEELEGLRLLEAENELLKQRIQDLENAAEPRACQEWKNTFTKEAVKTLNAEVKKSVENLEPQLHLRAIAKVAPEEKPRETITLLGLSLIAVANGHPRFATELRKAAACIFGVDEESLDAKKQQLEQLPQAIASFRQTLHSSPTWNDILTSGNQYPLIKQEVWLELTPEERAIIDKLNPAKNPPPNHWELPQTWGECKYQLIGQFHLIYNGISWLIVPLQDTESFSTPKDWFEAWMRGEVEEGAIALSNNTMVDYNYHASITEVNPDNNSLRVRWHERAGKPSEYEWFFSEDLGQLRVVPPIEKEAAAI